MASLIIPKQDDMRFDGRKKLRCAGRVWNDDEIEELLGPDFEIMYLRCDDTMYLEKGWDCEKTDLPFNLTATQITNVQIKGCVLICEREECRRK